MSLSKEILEKIKNCFPEHNISHMIETNPYIDSIALEKELRKISEAETSSTMDKGNASRLLGELMDADNI